MRFQKVLIVAAIIIGLLSALWLMLCRLLEERIPNALPARDEGYTFDYVVVGAGSAGATLAALLAKHGDGTVLLIEAGDTFGFLSRVPLLTTFQQQSVNDWGFLSVPQKHSSRGLHEQRQCLPRGKGLGGSAQLNYMLHFDGYAHDFDTWAAAPHNLSDWRWPAVRPFLQAAKAPPHEMYELPAHYSKLSAALHEAVAEFQHKGWHLRRAQYNIKNGQRHSVYHRFLQPALKYRNLRVMTNALAKRVQLVPSEHGQMSAESLLIGVKDEQTHRETTFSVSVRRELVLSAGAYQTPQLLLCSGIGEAAALRRLQIPMQRQLALVGQQLHDHLNLPLFVSLDVVGPTLNRHALLDPWSLLRYLHSGGGHWGNFGVLAHVDDVEAATVNGSAPFGLTFFGTGAIEETALMSISNFRREHFRALFPRYANASQEGFVAIANCLQPQSRGHVTIASANMRRNPLIDPNYLAAEADVACSIRAIRAAVQLIADSEALAALGARIHWPRLKECANFGPFARDFQQNRPSDRYLECLLRHVGLGSHHPAGSCRMGSNAQSSVVDGQFRLHGVPNLRVVDASVLPAPISGNPNSVVVGLAVRASIMILKAWQGDEADSRSVL